MVRSAKAGPSLASVISGSASELINRKITSATLVDRMKALASRGTPILLSFSAAMPRIMPTTTASVIGMRISDIR